MKLLIVTQKVDIGDSNLGSFHNWIEKMAQKADLFVVANFVGEYNLPKNVKVYSLGKEKNMNRFFKFLRYKYLLLKILPKTSGVFFHMCPEYVLAAGICPKVFRNKTLLWYTHKSVNWKLRVAEKLVDKIFTASKESFRLPSKKVEITGHGIDVNKFKSQTSKVKSKDKFQIITAGRISPVKNYEALIEVAEVLLNKNFNFEIKIVGAPTLESDVAYFEKIKKLVADKRLSGKVIFVGAIPNKNIVNFYQEGDLFVNLSDTGSIDKAMLEAMACELKVLTSNEAFRNILAEKHFTDKNPQKIAQKIVNLAGDDYDGGLRSYVSQNHNLENLIKRIINFFK